jgi:ATP-dependent RNA helicase DDX23/PRP28
VKSQNEEKGNDALRKSKDQKLLNAAKHEDIKPVVKETGIKKEPLSLEELLAKKQAAEAARSKVSAIISDTLQSIA